jgi:hypothetical protein
MVMTMPWLCRLKWRAKVVGLSSKPAKAKASMSLLAKSNRNFLFAVVMEEEFALGNIRNA